MILVDTNVVSELRKQRPHGGVLAWHAVHPLRQLCLSAITVFELQAGAERTRSSDPQKASELDRWIASLENSIAIYPFGPQEARFAAFLMRNKSQDLLQDAMIAATALTHEFPIATRNTRDFEIFGVDLTNPFLFRTS